MWKVQCADTFNVVFPATQGSGYPGFACVGADDQFTRFSVADQRFRFGLVDDLNRVRLADERPGLL